jgi:hypothetical protein
MDATTKKTLIGVLTIIQQLRYAGDHARLAQRICDVSASAESFQGHP